MTALGRYVLLCPPESMLIDKPSHEINLFLQPGFSPTLLTGTYFFLEKENSENYLGNKKQYHVQELFEIRLFYCVLFCTTPTR